MFASQAVPRHASSVASIAWAGTARGRAALVLATVLALIAGLVSMAPKALAADPYSLAVSSSPGRAAAVALDGLTVSGSIYVYTTPEAGVRRVNFYIDDPAAAGTVFHSEGTAPYDLVGGSPGAALPLDTHSLGDGTHTITQVITPLTGAVVTTTSTFVVANALAVPPPPAPTAVTAAAGNGSVDLAWTSGGGSTVGFNVFRSTSGTPSTGGTPLNGAVLITGTSYHDSEVVNDTQYRYLVQAVDADGRHSESSVAQATPTAPSSAPPFDLGLSTSSDRSAPTRLDGATVSGPIYVFTTPEAGVRRSNFYIDDPTAAGAIFHSEGTAPFDLVGGPAAAALPLDTTTLTDGTHTVTQVVTTTTNAIYTFTATFTVENVSDIPPEPAPPAPTGVTATPGNGFVDVAWTNAGGTTVGFNLYRGTTSSVGTTGTPLNDTVLITGTSFHDSTVTNGTTYHYRVVAVNSEGTATAAAAVNARPVAPPATPAYALLTSGSTDRSGAVALDGKILAGLQYVFTSPETSVRRVDFYLDDEAMAGAAIHGEATAPYDFIGGSPAAASPWNTVALADGRHTLTQKVTTTAGVIVVQTARFWIINTTVPPATPSPVSAVPGDGQVALSWAAPGATTLGFNVFRSAGGPVSLSGTPLNGATLLTGTTYVDTTVTNGTTYNYIVQAVDPADRRSESDPVSATPGSARLAAPATLALSAVVNQSVIRTFSLTNAGGSAVSVTGFAITGADAASFAVVSPTALPASIAPAGTLEVQVRFTAPGSAGLRKATLTVSSSGGAAAVGLGGLAVATAATEPSLQQILDAWSIPVNVGDPTPANIFLPTTSPLGDEVTVQSFVKAGAGPVSVSPLAVYTGTTGDPAARLAWVPEATANPFNAIQSVPAAQGRTLVVTPTGASSFNPGAFPFGLAESFGGVARTVYQDDTLNTFASALPRHMRVYPFKAADGTVVPETYVVAFEDYAGSQATTNAEWNDAVYVISNVSPVSLLARSVDRVPVPRRLVLSRIGTNLTPSDSWFTRETASLRFTNNSTVTRRVLSASVTGMFSLVAPTTFPATVAPGATLDVTVRYLAVAAPMAHVGSLVITTDDPAVPNRTIGLGGAWEASAGGYAEPQVTDQINGTFGMATTILKPGESINTLGRVQAVGEEILSPFMRQADPMRPVNVRQLSAFAGPSVSFGWVQQGSSRTTNLFTQIGSDGQVVLPRRSTSSGGLAAEGSFTTTSAFAFNIGGDYTDDTRNSTSYDRDWGCTTKCGHHVRIYPARDANGVLVPNTYILVRDFYGSSMDYNDGLYLVSNVKPA